ncbi:peptide chain release factor H [Parashewanella spongiae]|uniref:Peptide chain release factor H n=1 Tax=Parashewanella spongiae TaxID=342950 RepID=A0A3A6TIB6_9GAMM|nr:peptide chain release factor H [Parashewanella spongiae]MCL1079837.1 peptide chain release factor H [Parashewanella spongiae]RJY06674.1 peptide chain release factor H [Parashewanella spongiae]
MILLQLSAGQGPTECCKAVGLAIKLIQKQCSDKKVQFNLVEVISAQESGCFKSVLMQFDSVPKEIAKQFAQSWQGAMLWVCQSKYRPKHKRKNWFFSGQVYEVNDIDLDNAITYQACRSSGAGGQHVNTTDSAVRATHTATGISVRVESERSQHSNKRLAKALISQKLELAKHEAMSQQDKTRWQQHWELQRGNPVKVFKGEKFLLSN